MMNRSIKDALVAEENFFRSRPVWLFCPLIFYGFGLDFICKLFVHLFLFKKMFTYSLSYCRYIMALLIDVVLLS